MSALRLAAHRVGLIERMVPQELHTELMGVGPSPSVSSRATVIPRAYGRDSVASDSRPPVRHA